MAEKLNTQTKYPALCELLHGLTGFQFTDMEAQMISDALEIDKKRNFADFLKQLQDQKEIELIETFKTYKQVKQTR